MLDELRTVKIVFVGPVHPFCQTGVIMIYFIYFFDWKADYLEK